MAGLKRDREVMRCLPKKSCVRTGSWADYGKNRYPSAAPLGAFYKRLNFTEETVRIFLVERWALNIHKKRAPIPLRVFPPALYPAAAGKGPYIAAKNPMNGSEPQ